MYQLNSLLRLMATMAQLQQMQQLGRAMNKATAPGAASSEDVAEETDALAREQLRLKTLGESYKAYGKYCRAMGLEPSEEGYQSWYKANQPG